MDDLVGAWERMKAELCKRARDQPVDALLATVLGGGIAFYALERETNPQVATPLDAVLYVATCLSVGYDNVFPTTPGGHAIATLVQTFGPALAANAFEPPGGADREVVERLDKVIELLQARA